MDEIQFEAYARIEHVISGYWLHALRGKSPNMKTRTLNNTYNVFFGKNHINL